MRPVALIPLLAAGSATAGWEFSAPVEVAPPSPAVPHLESAGRRNLAVAGERVALVWEQGGKVLAALRRGDGPFCAPQLLSDGLDAYEPVLAPLPEGGFVAVWEQEGRLRGRLFGGEAPGPAAWIHPGPANQPTLDAAADGAVAIAFVDRGGRFGQVVAGELRIGPEGPAVAALQPADPGAPQQDQLYPAIAALKGQRLVAWEDRRAGHTRLLVAAGPGGAPFGPVRPLNELPAAQGSSPYGRGSGVTRVALADDGEGTVAAAWMDKRDFRGGYDIYAALSGDAGAAFGPNELVQDPFGDNTPQWHPVPALAPGGRLVVVWDDPRDGSADLFLAEREAPGRWSENLPLPGASGPGDQEHPVARFDAAGRLHVAWVERREGKGRLLYMATRSGG